MDPVVISIVATLATGFAGLVLRYAFRSKCTQVDVCFGCLKIVRDADAETAEEKLELEHNINLSDISK